MAASSLGGRIGRGFAGPHGAKFERKLLVLCAAGAGIDFGSPVARYLNGDVRGRAKPVEGETLAALDARKSQRTKSDNSGAEKRRGLIVAKGFGNRIDKLLGSDGVFGVAAVHGVAGESRMVAKIFFAGAAIFASLIGAVQPRNSHA